MISTFLPIYGVPARCHCHIHIIWNKIHAYVLEREDVGYGAEPVVYLIDEDAEPVVNLFYPEKKYEEVEALLNEVEQQR